MTHKEKKYCWSSPKCVRYNEDFTGENHPCYWCGKPPKDMSSSELAWCMTCGGFRCPHCGRCWCNGSYGEFEALQELRNKYCCDWPNFKGGLAIASHEDLHLLNIVPGFKLALDFCRERKGFVRKD